MTITINGTTGIAGVDGSAATPSVQGADTNTGVFFPAADTIAFAEGGVEAMRIDSSGNVGIGTTIPSTYGKLAVFGANQTNVFTASVTNTSFQSYLDAATGEVRLKAVDTSGANNSKYMTFYTQPSGSANTERMRISSVGDVSIGTTTPAGKLHVRAATNQNFVVQGAVSLPNAVTISAVNDANNANVPLEIRYATNVGFYDSGAERMRLDSSGNLLVGTATAGSAGTIITVQKGTATSWQVGPSAVNGNGGNFYVVNAAGTGVYVASGNTTWTANSDERLKNITGTIQNGVAKLSTLRAAEFTWKSDETNRAQIGLIAQDIQKVLPEVVDVSPDGTLGVRYTEVIPLLVAAIQEQQAMITALTDRITALEAK